MAKKDFWAKQEIILLRIILRALEELMLETNLPTLENDVSRKLHYSLQESRRREKNCLWHFFYQGHNQPVLEDKSLAYNPREEKKPDFTVSINDYMENMQKFFHVECKRVERNSDLGRNFYNEYVKDGVLRFKTAKHSYSKSVPLGIMIGYLRKCNYDEACSEIGKILSKNSLPKMDFLKDGNFVKVKQYSHDIDRPEVQPSPLRLRHFWAELAESN